MINTNDREELRNLIVKHFSTPEFKGVSGKGTLFESKSSTCSDAIALEIEYENEKVTNARFAGEGCAISLASADVFCQMILQKSKSEIKKICDEFDLMLKNEKCDETLLDELMIFRQIYTQRSRIACAKLPTIGLEIFLKK